MEKLGFIGMGNMAQAIADGLISKGMISTDHIYAYAPHKEKLQRNAEQIGFIPVESLEKLVQKVDTVVVACKPYQVEDVLGQLSGGLQGKNLLSVALSWDFAKYHAILGDTVHIQFIMPNTPARVGEGVFLFEEKNSLKEQDREQIMKMFSALGKVAELPTELMGIGGAITGCGPAFVDLFLEGFADAAVKYGIPRKLAYELVSQTVLGSAKLQLATGEHPGVLKDAVCSPGGTTIRGVDALEHAGLRAACIDAIDAVMRAR